MHLLNSFLTRTRILLVTIAAFCMAQSASAHHSATAYNEEATTEIEGVVEKLIWRNPHIIIELNVESEDGESAVWPLETAGIQNLVRAGWTKDKVAEGVPMKAEIHPMKSGAPGGILRWVTLTSGEVLAIDAEAPASYAGGAAPASEESVTEANAADVAPALELPGTLQERAAKSREDYLKRRAEWETFEAEIRPDKLPRESDESAAGALDPENIESNRGKAVFDFTGIWSHRASRDQSERRGGKPWHFLPVPELTPKTQAIFEDVMARREAGDPTADPATLCYPHGMPRIMTRIGNMMLLQEPTAIFMVHRMNNDYRAIFTDGRDHVDPSVRVDSYNGDSIAFWEDDALYVETVGFGANNHFVQEGIPIGPKGKIVERWRLINDGNTLEIEYRMTDPEHWVGEWVDFKLWDRIHGADIRESSCILAEEGSLAGSAVIGSSGAASETPAGAGSSANTLETEPTQDSPKDGGGFLLPLLFGAGIGFGLSLVLPLLFGRKSLT